MANKRSGFAGPLQNTQNQPGDPLRRPDDTTSRLTTFTEALDERLRAIPPRRFVAIGLACIVGVGVMSVVNSARRQAADWGTTATVLVAVQSIPQGIVLSDSDVELRPIPLALLPSDPLGSLGEGWVAQAPIAAGQALTRATVAQDRNGLTGSQRVVTLPLPLAPPKIQAGDFVEIFSVSGTTDGRVAAVVVAPGARVAGIDEDGITVVVSAPEAEGLLAALAVGSVEFARRPSQP